MVKAALANSAWCLASLPACAAFKLALDDPARAQEMILRRYLRENARTAFGREHGFAEIRSYEQFTRCVPPRDYDELWPWIERVRRGERDVLTAEPVKRLAPTSGSTCGRKLIPYTASMQRELNAAIGPWIVDLYRQRPEALAGPAYWSVTPVCSDDVQDDSAIPIGFDEDAEYLGGWRKRLVEAAMATPGGLQRIQSIEAWRYATLLLLLRRRDLAMISIWHPSFLDLLLRELKEKWRELIADVAAGGCALESRLPEQLTGAMRGQRDARRAAELERAGPENVTEIWPMLRIISCWADAGAAGAASALAKNFPSLLVQPKGLLATEGVVSIPYQGRHPLAIRSHFLEFEDDGGRISPPCDLRAGQTYRVLLTNGGGLYRYRLNDVVRVDGMVGRTASIRFVGKAGLISDRMGEKLAEAFVAGVLACVFSHVPAFAMLAPEADSEGCWYTLYVDERVEASLADVLDRALCDNPHYAYCRRLGQLLPVRIFQITGDAYGQYGRRLMKAGQRLGDIKAAALSALDGWSTHFSGDYVRGESIK